MNKKQILIIAIAVIAIILIVLLVGNKNKDDYIDEEVKLEAVD